MQRPGMPTSQVLTADVLCSQLSGKYVLHTAPWEFTDYFSPFFFGGVGNFTLSLGFGSPSCPPQRSCFLPLPTLKAGKLKTYK